MRRARKRRSSAALSERALKDIRKLHRAHLREISAILTNALGFPVRVSLVPTAIVDEKPRKRGSRVSGVSRQAAELAGFGVPAKMEWPAFERFMSEEPEGDDTC